MVDRCSCSAGKKDYLSYRSGTTASSISTMRMITTKIQSSCDEQGSTKIITAQPLNIRIAMVSKEIDASYRAFVWNLICHFIATN